MLFVTCPDDENVSAWYLCHETIRPNFLSFAIARPARSASNHRPDSEDLLDFEYQFIEPIVSQLSGSLPALAPPATAASGVRNTARLRPAAAATALAAILSTLAPIRQIHSAA